MLRAKLSAMPGVGGWGMYGGNRLIWVWYVLWQQVNVGGVCMVATGSLRCGMYGGNRLI